MNKPNPHSDSRKALWEGIGINKKTSVTEEPGSSEYVIYVISVYIYAFIL